MTHRRAQRDLADMQSGGLVSLGCDVCVIPVNSLTLHIKVVPDFGAFAGQHFQFELIVTASYPFRAPIVRCLSADKPHPNIDLSTGQVFVALMEFDYWRPIFSLSSIVSALQLLFHLDKADDLMGMYQLSAPVGFAATSSAYKESCRVSVEANRACARLQRTLPAAVLNPRASFFPSPALLRSRNHRKRSASPDNICDDRTPPPMPATSLSSCAMQVSSSRSQENYSNSSSSSIVSYNRCTDETMMMIV
jgi:ubiquitin-protein ligase